MGPSYNYERVLKDSNKYLRIDDQGRTVAWWKDYLEDEGFEVEHRPLSDFRSFSEFGVPAGKQSRYAGLSHAAPKDRPLRRVPKAGSTSELPCEEPPPEEVLFLSRRPSPSRSCCCEWRDQRHVQ